MMSSVGRVKFIKTKVGNIPKASQSKFHQIWITKLKLMFKFQYQNGEKQKSGKTFCGLQNGARGIIKRGSFRDFKSW